MKILFVCSGNNNDLGTPIVRAQADSLQQLQVNVIFYYIKGRGVLGYLKNIVKLSQFIQQQHPDVIHAHYSLSGIVASLATFRPVVVSLMGSDIKAGYLWNSIIKSFSFLRWKHVIVKSQRMKEQIGIQKAVVIPNGVNMQEFKPLDREACMQQLKYDTSFRHVVFIANPDRYEKNFPLAKLVIEKLADSAIQFHVVHQVEHDTIPVYLNAADALLLTSYWEGSPNVVKEALACNCPVVATDVGDIANLTKGIDGCFVCDFNPESLVKALKSVLQNNRRLDARKSVEHLDSSVIAKKIVDLYTQK